MNTAERIDLPGTFNFRDVGGYRTPDGVVREGRLYRSDALASLGDAGRASLTALGVGTIIDLRDKLEIDARPDDVDGLPIEVIHLPLFEGSSTSAGVVGASLPALYERIITGHARVVAEAVRDVARAGEGGVIVHCTAGKDRTGVVIALTLLTIGVDRQDVLDDYAASEGNLDGAWLEEMLRVVAEHGVEQTPQLRVLLGGSPREALESALDLVDARFGSARGYLLASGLTVEELALLHTSLVRVIQ
jgi:protein-tyrosine phosphatase